MVDGLNGYGQWESQSRKFFMTVSFGISGFSFATTHRSLHIDRRYLKASKTTVVSQWRIATQSTDRWVKFLWSHYKFLHSANWPPIQPSQKGSRTRKLVGLFWVYVVEFRKNPPQTQILPKKTNKYSEIFWGFWGQDDYKDTFPYQPLTESHSAPSPIVSAMCSLNSWHSTGPPGCKGQVLEDR